MRYRNVGIPTSKTGGYNENRWTITARLLTRKPPPHPNMALQEGLLGTNPNMFDEANGKIAWEAFSEGVTEISEESYYDSHYISKRATMIPLRAEAPLDNKARQAKSRAGSVTPHMHTTGLIPRDIGSSRAILETLLEELTWTQSDTYDKKYKMLLVDCNIYTRMLKVMQLPHKHSTACDV
jgi:hypothetical protein